MTTVLTSPDTEDTVSAETDYTTGIDDPQLRNLAMHFARKDGLATSFERSLLLDKENPAVVRRGMNLFIIRRSQEARKAHAASLAAMQEKHSRRFIELWERAERLTGSDEWNEVEPRFEDKSMVAILTNLPGMLTSKYLDQLNKAIQAGNNIRRAIVARDLEAERAEFAGRVLPYVRENLSDRELALIQQELPESAPWNQINLVREAMRKASRVSSGDSGRSYGQRLGDPRG